MTATAMGAAGIVLLLVGGWAARRDVAAARGLDRILALANPCVAAPLAVFGALHLFGPSFVAEIVPSYMPWRSFWVYAVGCALIAAALSIATGIAVRWSGLLFGIMMFLFVAMIHLPGALRQPHDRFLWTIVVREMSFGGAGWILAGSAIGSRDERARRMIAVGRVFVTAAMLLFGVEHLLHPTALPGVPLKMLMPAWIPARALIDEATGAALLLTAGSILVSRGARVWATCLGGWLLLLVVVIYGPVMITALSGGGPAAKVVGINYFADTLLFAGAVLALAKATPRPEAAGRERVALGARASDSAG